MSRESSLKASFMEGFFTSIKFGLTFNFITPFALILGAGNFSIGLLNSLPALVNSIIQLKANEVLKWIGSRVKHITWGILSEAIFLILIGLIFLVPKRFQVETYVFLIIASDIFVSTAVPVWLSLISDTVEKQKYGEYFAWRGKILGFSTLCSSFIAGFFLFIIHNKLTGFVIIFLVAGILRVFSAICQSKMDDVPIKTSEKKDFSYFQFIRRASESNFVKFVLFVSLINFTLCLAAPFFSVYMLKELNFKYSTYTIIISSGALAGLLLMPFWGKLADKYGNVKIIKSTVVLFPFSTAMWLLSKNPVYLIILNAFGGYLWAGFALTVINFIFDAASHEVRTRCASYYNFTVGLFAALGAFSGGWLSTHLPFTIFGSKLLALFFLSAVSTFLVNILMIRSFHEVREAEKIEDKKMMHIVLGIRPILSLGEEILYVKGK
ncbi:MAG: MFS transporter [Elusimicrobia bacterium]|nr:MFS transporter [Elusimicrobiota bacterium]